MVAQARAAQLNWQHAYTTEERVALIKSGLKALAARKEALADMISREMGKVISEARNEADGATSKDLFLDSIAVANQPVVVGSAGEAQSLIVRDAMGIVVVLAPWNFPADEILLLSLPALCAGNTVIVKPSEVAPLTGAMVVHEVASCLPRGVFQVAQGDGAVGAQLVAAPVDMVAMTGSTAVGKKLMAGCAEGLKRLVLELGGKDPMVVFADADLDRAAHDAVFFSLFNCGQVCCSVERVYVAAAVREEFERKVVALAATYATGPGADEASKVGPMVSKMQCEIVADQVASAVAAGARVLYRGSVPEGAGNWHPVVVLGGLSQDMKIQTNETFGPVVALASFDGTEAEAVRLANDTEYGLAAYVYTKDMGAAKRVAAGIRAGQVGVNCYSLFHANVACPWVGHKGSGFGYHSGYDGWRQFSVPKSIVFESALPECLSEAA
jgi:acyl-CoA reductase-like NAD-dependent aldehyde dehydrogenase